MFNDKAVFSGFSVDDLSLAESFYGEILGLDTTRTDNGLYLQLATGGKVFVYAKSNHTPATFTILNFPTDDIEATVKTLHEKGVTFEHYHNITDELGIAQDNTPKIAWFKDPAGNILSVIEDTEA
ncbi:MAG: VOC family protein [Chloroflexota bacterium]